MMPGKKRSCSKLLEGEFTDRSSCFLGQPATPKFGAKMKTQFVNLLLGPIRPQARATGVLIVFKKNRPVLNLVILHQGDFGRQPQLDLCARERTPN